MTEHKKRPEAGKLTVGQDVMVLRSPNETRWNATFEGKLVPAVVVKVGRVWVDLEAVGGRRTWRMRISTQNEGSKYSGSNASFATMAQHEWDRDHNDAVKTLRDQGIELSHQSPWRGREIELAEFVSNAVDKGEES